VRSLVRGLVAIALLIPLACTSTDVKGSYDVTLEIAGSPRVFEGVLILSTAHLDIPSLSEEDSSIDPEWFGGDALAANSCFILEPPSTLEENPEIVRVFEARIFADRVTMPIEIVTASDLSIRIVSLQFFANTLGGELEIETPDGIRPGQIFGERTGPAHSQKCIDSLEIFRATLRAG
jgi:hypothetical protein